METVTISDLISTYSKFIEEAIQDYTEKNKISSIPAENVNLLNQHVVTYFIAKTADPLSQIPKFNGAERTQEILEEETGFAQDKCMEPAQTHQSSTAPSEIKEISKEAEIIQEIPEEEKCFEQVKCIETAEIHQSSTAPSKVIVDGDLFMKMMSEHHKQQQEFQDKIFTTLLDQLNHHHTRQEQNLQQQSKFYEQFLQQQQDFQSKLMGDFMKHTEMQATLFCQALSNGKAEQPVHDNHCVNVDEKPPDTSCYQPSNSERTYNSSTGHNSISGRGAAGRSASFAHFEPPDTSCYQPSNSERTYNSSTGHNSISGRGAAGRSASFAHFEVANGEKQAFQVFDCHKLGQEFCNWFYSRLNSQNTASGQERIAWEPEMFWNDVKFSFAHDDCFEEYTGDECVNEKLLVMTQEQNLTFTPELDGDRFKCVNSRHGLVVVAVTGVISKNDYSTVFRQIFGLIKCPSTGKYKIKTINLRVHNMNPSCAPLLQYTTEELQDFKIQSAQQYL